MRARTSPLMAPRGRGQASDHRYQQASASDAKREVDLYDAAPVARQREDERREARKAWRNLGWPGEPRSWARGRTSLPDA